MKHCHFSILYNELPFLKQKLPFLYVHFDQIIFYDLNVTTDPYRFSTDGSHEFILNYPDPANKITLIEETDLSHVTQYYGGSGIAKRKMFTLASQRIKENIDVFWCSDLDEFFHPSLLKEVETVFEDNKKVNSINLEHYYFWKDFDLLMCDPESDIMRLPPRIARHQKGNVYGHCSLHEQYPQTYELKTQRLYHFAWLGEERCQFKFDYWGNNCAHSDSQGVGEHPLASSYRHYADTVWKTFDKKQVPRDGTIWGYPNLHPNPIIKKGIRFFNKEELPYYVNYKELAQDLNIK